MNLTQAFSYSAVGAARNRADGSSRRSSIDQIAVTSPTLVVGATVTDSFIGSFLVAPLSETGALGPFSTARSPAADSKHDKGIAMLPPADVVY